MNLLVTNTRTAQAYSLIKELRPYANKIVAEMYGRSWLAARISPAANSRLVDRRYRVPYPTYDWQTGNIQRENTEREELYFKEILRICEKESIDTIFPSFDPHVFIFSKNKHRLKERGIVVPVPDYDVLLQSLDKYRTVQAARASGFPHPRTWLADSDDAVREAAAETGPPWIVRPRFTAGSRGLEIVTDGHALAACVERINRSYGTPIIQEYVGGMGRQNFYLVADASADIKFIYCPRVLRCSQRIFRNAVHVAEGAADHPLIPLVKKFVKHLGWTGPLTIQTKLDPKTGEPKLLEINPRVGTHLWCRIASGVNEPMMCLKIARGESVETATQLRTGMLLLEPTEDAIAIGFEALDRMLYNIRVKWRGRETVDPASVPLPIGQIFPSYLKYYRTKQEKVFSPMFTSFRNDPLVAILWAYTIFRSWMAYVPRLGR